MQFDNVRVEIGKSTDVPGGFYDDRPIGSGVGGAFAGIYTNIIAGIYAREVNGLTLRNTRVIWDTPKNPVYGQGMDQFDISNLTLDHDNFDPAPASK